MRLAHAALALTLLASSVVAAPTRDLTPSEKKMVADAVTKDLKNPSATQFRWGPIKYVSPAEDAEGGFSCGQVYGDSHGSYLEFKPFLAELLFKDKKLSLVSVTVGGNGGATTALVNHLCARNGLNPADAK